MDCAEDYVRYLCQYLLDHCLLDMEFFDKNIDKTALSRLKMVATTPFERLTYTAAVDILKKVSTALQKLVICRRFFSICESSKDVEF